jgi:hypothetical protein
MRVKSQRLVRRQLAEGFHVLAEQLRDRGGDKHRQPHALTKSPRSPFTWWTISPNTCRSSSKPESSYSGHKPADALIGVARLARPEFLIEVDAIAVK